jgi:hypothetical protein
VVEQHFRLLALTPRERWPRSVTLCRRPVKILIAESVVKPGTHPNDGGAADQPISTALLFRGGPYFGVEMEEVGGIVLGRDLAELLVLPGLRGWLGSDGVASPPADQLLRTASSPSSHPGG